MSTPEQEWGAYLDAIEAAARAMEQHALGGQPPEPAPAPAAVPELPWPASLDARRREVMATLAVVTATVERSRDAAGAALAALPRPPGRHRNDYADGTTLDIVG